MPESPVVPILSARRADLVGGGQSIGEQKRLIDEQQAALDAALACLAACEAELVEIDRVIALLSPEPEPEPPGEEPTDPTVPTEGGGE